MATLNLAERKLLLFQKILKINCESDLNLIEKYLDEISEKKVIQVKNENYDKNHWIYSSDKNNTIRYVLGIKGKKTLLCFGINPSTAAPNNLDNTLKSVERLSKNNGYDSWIMMNIYPQRATNPNNMHFEIDKLIHLKNLEFLENVLKKGHMDIWAGWGTLIEKRSFLISCLNDIYEITKKYNCNWFSIGKNSKKGHPHHPLYLKSTEKVKGFPIESYIQKLNP